VKPILARIAGYGFLVLGIVGLVLPFLQGVLFILIGLLILSRYEPWAARLLDSLKRRFPPLEAMTDRAQGLMRRWSRIALVRGRRLFRLGR
jgi:uncharacterized membrane protein YbaN (DUF454 family)